LYSKIQLQEYYSSLFVEIDETGAKFVESNIEKTKIEGDISLYLPIFSDSLDLQLNNNNNLDFDTSFYRVSVSTQPLAVADYGNYVWEDTNQNGIQDGSEFGIDGVRVELYEDDGDGIRNSALDVMESFTITSGGGSYLFS